MDMLTKSVQLPDLTRETPPPAARPVAPVMDILPPQAETAVANDVHKAPPAEDESPADEKSGKKTKETKQPKVVRINGLHQQGVGGAIFASVVIVLGLAALATYVYLKTNNIAVL